MTSNYKQATFSQIAQAMIAYDNFVICGHVNPDGDCVSSQAALALALKSIGKNVVNLLADKPRIDANCDFLPGASEFIGARDFDPNQQFDGEEFVFVSVDVPLVRRTGKYTPAIKDKAALTITIDHHEPEDLDSNLVFCDSTAASASLLIWEFIPYLEAELSADIALCCLTGLISDTGSFRYQNADSRAFNSAAKMVELGADPSLISRNLFQRRSLKSLKMESRTIEHLFVNSEMRFAISYLSVEDFEEFDATKADADYMVDLIRSLDCVDVVCMLRQEFAGQDIHGSLRSKNDLDVSKVARQYVGGGHKAAAGFTMKNQTDLQSAIGELKIKLAELCSNETRNN